MRAINASGYAKPTIDEKLMEQQDWIETLVARLNYTGDPDAALVAQRAVVSTRELRNACEEAAIDHCDFDWEPAQTQPRQDQPLREASGERDELIERIRIALTLALKPINPEWNDRAQKAIDAAIAPSPQSPVPSPSAAAEPQR